MPSSGVGAVALIEEEEEAVDTMDQSIDAARSTPSTKAATEKELPPPFMVGEGLPSVPPKLVIKNSTGRLRRYGGASP